MNNDNLLFHDAKQRGTFHSARWQHDYSPDLCWISTTVGRSQPASSVVFGDFHLSQHRPSVIHIGLQLPIIIGVQCRRWNFRKADWASYTLATERFHFATASALRNHTSVSVVLYRKQPAIPFHEASVQRILRVWMRSAKIYSSSMRSLVTQT